MPKKSKRTRNRTTMALSAAVVVLLAVSLYEAVSLTALSGQLTSSNLKIQQLDHTIASLNVNPPNGTKVSLPQYNITFDSPVPPTSLASAPVITQNQAFGQRLTNINAPLNATELSIINNAPNSYFETAGEMYLNGTLSNYVGVGGTLTKVNSFIVNGKPSVIYFGSITCVFCGENRWAMALALSRFGSFGNLFKGYSSFGDGNLPTLYWRPDEYNNATINVGNFYNSNSINFISLEDSNPIRGGFNLQSFPQVATELNLTGNTAYIDALNYILAIGSFSGTPYTIWGKYIVSGADAVDFGNTTPSSSTLPLTNMTHSRVLSQLQSPNDQFAWTEYAGADIYIAITCASTNSTAQACTLPAIKGIEAKLGVSQ